MKNIENNKKYKEGTRFINARMLGKKDWKAKEPVTNIGNNKKYYEQQ
jgi:hypothetical protein